MVARAVWRPPWYVWAIFGLALLLTAYKLQPAKFEGHWIVITPLAIVAGVLALRKLWELPPAVSLCIAIALTVFSGGWKLMGLGGLPLNRLMVVIVLLQILLRAPGTVHMPRLRLRNVHLLMAVTLIYALASAVAAGTLSSKATFLLYFDVLGVTPYLLFLFAPSIFARRRERDLLLATLVGIGAYLGITAVFETFGPSSLVFPSYIHQADLSSFTTLKAGGPFQSTVAEGFAAFACAVASVIAFTQWSNWRWRCVAAVVAILCSFACFSTLERGVWIAAIAATAASSLMTRAGRRVLAPGLVLALIAILGTLSLSPVLATRTSARAADEESVWDRQNQTAAGLRMVAAKPLSGFGFDRYVTDSLEYFRQPVTYPMVGWSRGLYIAAPHEVLPLHNTYLSYAVELGLIGVLLWLASLLWALVEGLAARGSPTLRPWKHGLLAISVFFLVVSFVDPHATPFPITILLLWAGLATARPSSVPHLDFHGELR